MNTKHSPGPWEAVLESTINNPHIKKETTRFKIVSGDIEIATLFAEGEFRDHRTATETKANAKLIAAVPELLEALVTLKEWVGKLDDWKGIDPPCEIVDLAIKKATE